MSVPCRRFLLCGVLLLWLPSAGCEKPMVGRVVTHDVHARTWYNTDVTPSLGDLRGRIVVLEFWATWCRPCIPAVHHLNEINAEWSEKGVVIIGMSDEDEEDVEQFMQGEPMDYIVGAGSSSIEDFRIGAYPHAVLINPDGAVVWEGHPLGDLDYALRVTYEKTPPQK